MARRWTIVDAFIHVYTEGVIAKNYCSGRTITIVRLIFFYVVVTSLDVARVRIFVNIAKTPSIRQDEIKLSWPVALNLHVNSMFGEGRGFTVIYWSVILQINHRERVPYFSSTENTNKRLRYLCLGNTERIVGPWISISRYCSRSYTLAIWMIWYCVYVCGNTHIRSVSTHVERVAWVCVILAISTIRC